MFPPPHHLKVLNYMRYRSRVPNSTSSEDESQTKKRKVVSEIHSSPPKPAPRYNAVFDTERPISYWIISIALILASNTRKTWYLYKKATNNLI